jgi:hypothetical protein
MPDGRRRISRSLAGFLIGSLAASVWLTELSGIVTDPVKVAAWQIGLKPAAGLTGQIIGRTGTTPERCSSSEELLGLTPTRQERSLLRAAVF